MGNTNLAIVGFGILIVVLTFYSYGVEAISSPKVAWALFFGILLMVLGLFRYEQDLAREEIDALQSENANLRSQLGEDGTEPEDRWEKSIDLEPKWLEYMRVKVGISAEGIPFLCLSTKGSYTDLLCVDFSKQEEVKEVIAALNELIEHWNLVEAKKVGV